MPFFPKKEFGSTPTLDYRASHISAYFLRGFRSLMTFVQLVNSVPTPLYDQAKYAERTWDQYANTYFERAPYPSPSGIRTVLDSITKDNPKAKGGDPASFVDASILKSLDDSGFIKSLYD